MNNAEYWARRLKIMEDAIKDKSYEYVRNLEEQFDAAIRDIDTQMRAWYQRFATNNNITYAEAQRLLTTTELEEFRWTVQEYIKKGKENAINQAWLKELENASVRVHISRLDALKYQLRQQAEVLTDARIKATTEAAELAYTQSYYHTAYEVQKGLGVGWTMQAINENALQKVLSRPWTVDNQTFRARCWTDKTKLVQTVNQELTRMIATGEPPNKAVNAIAKQFKTTKYNAGRVVMTESAYFSAAAQKDCFNRLGVELYKVVGTLDKTTCDICADMDGRIFKMAEYKEGATAPPFHPWCRCCTAPYFEDMEGLGLRASRDPDTGKTIYKVPANMPYKEWKKQFVDGTPSTPEVKDDIIYPWDAWKRITGDHDIPDDLSNVNPNYHDGGRPYRVNCTHCVPTYEMRRRGFDVEATPAFDGDAYMHGAWRKLFKGAEWKHTTSRFKKDQAAEIERIMLGWGEGARAEIRVAWDTGSMGHVFAAEVKDGKVLFVDPQSGSRDVRHYFNYAKPSSVEYGRIDNLVPTEGILETCKSR